MKTKKRILGMLRGLVGWMLVCGYTAGLAGAAADPKLCVVGSNAFAYDLYAKLRGDKGNLFFSPYSITTVLAMTYAGARGETAQQMARTLHFPLEQDALHPACASLADHLQQIQKKGDVTLHSANALWIEQDIKLRNEFLRLTREYYGANLFPLDFKTAFEAARVKINEWIEKQTNAKIKDLLPPGVLSAATRLVLTNALYFKGQWSQQFEKDATSDEPFWLTAEQQIPVPMMHQQADFKYGETDSVQILEMPCAGEDLAMILLLPKARNGLAALEPKLEPEQVNTWLAEATVREVTVSIPKFTLTAQFSLAATLQALGMTAAFSESADFSGMAEGTPLSISEVMHKAFLEVSEAGAEAAAATGGVIGVTAVREPQPIPEFKADHPFLFLIQDRSSKSILFLGRLVNPAE